MNSKDLLELPFSYIKTGHLIVQGKVSGKKMTWLVDTGASNTVIHTEKAIELGLNMVETEKKGGGVGSQSMDLLVVSGLVAEFKGQYFPIPDCNSMDLTHVIEALKKRKARKVYAILGADFLKLYGAVIDFQEKVIRINAPEQGTGES